MSQNQHRLAAVQRQRADRAVDRDHADRIFHDCGNVPVRQIMDTVRHAIIFRQTTDQPPPGDQPGIERMLLDHQQHVSGCMMGKAFDDEAQRRPHVAKGRMDAQLIIGIQLQRQGEIALSFHLGPGLGRLLQVAIAHHQLSRPGQRFHEETVRPVGPVEGE